MTFSSSVPFAPTYVTTIRQTMNPLSSGEMSTARRALAFPGTIYDRARANNLQTLSFSHKLLPKLQRPAAIRLNRLIRELQASNMRCRSRLPEIEPLKDLAGGISVITGALNIFAVFTFCFVSANPLLPTLIGIGVITTFVAIALADGFGQEEKALCRTNKRLKNSIISLISSNEGINMLAVTKLLLNTSDQNDGVEENLDRLRVITTWIHPRTLRAVVLPDEPAMPKISFWDSFFGRTQNTQ